jgi:hypothetical protein
MDGPRRPHRWLYYCKLVRLTPGTNARAGQRAKKEFNLVMVHPDEAEWGVESWTAEGNVDKMKENYKLWSTTLVTPFKSPPYAHANQWCGTVFESF